MATAPERKTHGRDPASRARAAVRAVLPRSANVRSPRDAAGADLVVNGQTLRIHWAGEGWLRQVKPVVAAARDRPDVVVARRMSPGAREALSKAGIGWVDETGGAEIAVGSLVVSRTGHPEKADERPARWTPAVLAVAEAILCGTTPTVAATEETTGLSTGSCTNALRVLTDLELLTAQAERGRDSARKIADRDELLDAYASAAAALKPKVSLTVGVTWRDVLTGLAEVGQAWDRVDVAWAATGAAASLLIAPLLTSVGTAEVFVEAQTIAELQAVAERAGLKSIAGGRLTLLPFPTVTTSRLATELEGVRLAPWPRVYADLRTTGVRGEDAAEHLREVMRDR